MVLLSLGLTGVQRAGGDRQVPALREDSSSLLTMLVESSGTGDANGDLDPGADTSSPLVAQPWRRLV
jgi:hypothetical protein